MRKRFLSFEVKKNYEHIIGEVDGSYMNSWHELLEAVSHQDMANDEQIGAIESLLDGCSEVIGDYVVSINIDDEETTNALIETLNDLYNLEEE